MFGARRTNDEAMQGCYIVKQLSGSYIVQKNTTMKGVEPSQTEFSRDLICDAVFWKPVPNDIDWYTSMDKENCYVMIIVEQVL